MVDNTRRRLFGKRALNHADNPLPWLKQPKQFTEQCTRCERCVSACETQVIIKGDGGFPCLDFSKAECSFCYRCAAACPEALFLNQDHLPWHAKANVESNCLAQRNVDCRSCGDSCDEMAIHFKLAIGHVATPSIDEQSCSGCGACVSVCPVQAINIHHR